MRPYALPLMVVLALLALLVGWGGSALDEEGASLHLQQAEWLAAVPDAGLAPGSAVPAQVASADLPGAWQAVSLPHAPPVRLLAQARAGQRTQSLSWYRLQLPARPAGGDWMLYAPRLRDDGPVAIYLDGRLLQRIQPEGPLWNSSRTPLWLALPAPPAGGAPQELLIRLQHSSRSSPALSSLRVGPQAALQWRWQARQWLQLTLPTLGADAFLAAGLASLWVWCRRRADPVYLLFFGLATAAYVRCLHFHLSLPIANDAFAWLSLNALFALIVIGHLFAGRMHRRPSRAGTRLLLAVCGAVALLTLPLGPEVGWTLANTPQVTPLIYLLAMLLCLLVSVDGWRRARGRSGEARRVAVGIALCLLLGVGDWLQQNNRMDMEWLYPGAYTALVTFAVFGHLMFRRYARALQQLFDANAHLGRSLRQREQAFERSQAQLLALDRQQALAGERQRLMQDMHDGLGASLHTALRVLERGRLGPAEMEPLLSDCVDDLDFALAALQPQAAGLPGLLVLLQRRVLARLSRSGLEVRWQVQELPDLDWLDARRSQHVLRILQEAVSNVLKHTAATALSIASAVDADFVHLSVRDNGAGFDAQAALRQGGKGLGNQRRRAELIGATLRWQHANKDEGTGTCVTLSLPRRGPATGGVPA